MDHHNLQIVAILTVGFALASLLGYLAQRAKLPTIFGYLLAGYLIGPFSPGYVANLEISEQLAEVGVILMLFGVGLHFKLQDLNNVKSIAIPGAIGQTLVASLIGFLLVYYSGWSLSSGIIIGLAISVASTVVLVHVLSEKSLIETKGGHIAIGWLVVEDMFTVAILILLPMLSTYINEGGLSLSATLTAVLSMLGKFVALAAVMFLVGQRAIKHILTGIARLRSHELLTLTVLAIAFAIATTSTVVFGMSVALGAFLAGMVIGQTHIRHQASASLLPLKDTFAVIFFLSVGMLFNPQVVIDSFPLFLGVLAIILIAKPAVAFIIAILFKHPVRTALTIAIALAQIGEFSFILAEEALKYKLLPDEGYDLLVACALVSISINPLLFNAMDFFERHIRKFFMQSPLQQLLPHPSQEHVYSEPTATESHAILVGFGPIGQSVFQTLENLQKKSIVIEQNIDTVMNAKGGNLKIIFGDASNSNILHAAHIEHADLLIVSVPDTATLLSITRTAKELNPDIKILARSIFISEQKQMEEMGVDCICAEKEVLEQFIKKVRSTISGEEWDAQPL